ncbi:unnamed protein product [Penicillium salamii]|nr:unnamed protein product [Penicillium salamii]
MRCPSLSCHLGLYCWQDAYRKKRYQLRTHHLKHLMAYVKGGGILECQDDVPDAVREELFLEEQQKLESQQSKSNKILASGNCPSININFIGGQPHLQSPVAYSTAVSDIHISCTKRTDKTNVVDDNLKAQFRQACDATLVNGLDLEQIHEDRDPGFFIEKGVAVGIARRFVSDIVRWARHVRS